MGKWSGNLGKLTGKLGKLSRKLGKLGMRPKKCPHLFLARKLGKMSKIWKVRPENLESNLENSECLSGILKKFNQIRKVPSEN